MRKTLVGLVGLAGLLLSSGGVSAQCTRIIQNGTVQNNAPVVWVAPCVVGQAGPSTGSSGNPVMLKDLGVQGNIGILDGPNTGQWHGATLGWNPTVPGEFDWNLSGFGGANLATAAVILNGVKYPFPGAAAGNMVGPSLPNPVSGDIVLWNGGLTTRDGGPPILGPSATTVGDCAFFNNTSGTLLVNRPCMATSTSALATIPANAGGSVEINSTTAPSVVYVASAAACLFSDGGYCFPAGGGGGYSSWVMAPQTIYDIRWWGLTSNPINFYVNSSTGNDYSGTNLCVKSSVPCATLAQAVTAAAQFCAASGAETINLAAGTYTNIMVSGNGVCNGGRGGGVGIPLNISGAGSSSTFIVDPCSPGCSFAVLALSQGAYVTLSGVTLTAQSTQDGIGLFGSGNTFAITGTDTILTGVGGAPSAIHIEGQSRAVFGKNVAFTVGGAWGNIGSADYLSNFTFDGGDAITCAGGAAFSSAALFIATYNSTLDFAGTETFPGCGGNTVFALYQGSRANTGSTTFGTLPPILQSKSTTDQMYLPCVGGAVSCPVATTPTGFGTTPTSSVTNRSAVFGGQVLVTAGAAPSAAGTIWLSFPVFLQTVSGTQITCLADIGNSSGGTAWPAGSTAWIGADNNTGGMNIRIDWQSNSSNLVQNDIYALNWMCNN